MVYCTVAQKK